MITSPSAVARLAIDALEATLLREAKCSMEGDTWRHGLCGAEGAGSKVEGWLEGGRGGQLRAAGGAATYAACNTHAYTCSCCGRQGKQPALPHTLKQAQVTRNTACHVPSHTHRELRRPLPSRVLARG